MSQKSSTSTRVSSPASTGGAGTSFEQHVGAQWLALLLVRGIPPVLVHCTIAEVCFQTERFGWNTDDFLLVCDAGSGIRPKLLGQVKRSFTVSATNEDCVQTIGDCWKDFKNADFSAASDRLVIVTMRGTNTLLEHFVGLLDCARAAKDAADFERRLSTPGFIDKRAQAYLNEIHAIVNTLEQQSLAISELWPFLKILHLLSLDLTTSTRQTEAQIKTLLAYTTNDPDPVASADITWNALLREVGDANSQAKSFDRNALPEQLKIRHSPVSIDDHRALAALKDHSAVVLNGIRTHFGPNHELHLERTGLIQTVIAQLESSQVVLVAGSAGSGKSVAAKSAVTLLTSDHYVFCFRAEEFAKPHLDGTLAEGQIPIRAAGMTAVLAGQGRKILLIESVERLLEASTREAFSDLLTLVKKDKSWRLLLTCRDYSVDLVRSSLLDFVEIGHSVIAIPLLDDAGLDEIQRRFPDIGRPLSSPSLRSLLRNPYVLDMALRMPWPADRPLPTNEREFRARFWREIVRSEQNAADAMPRRRGTVFGEIALRRARALTPYAACNDLDPAAVDKLRHDSLIVFSPSSNLVAAPAHDVLEDWAILGWIDDQYALHHGSVAQFANALGTYPAVRRTSRKWIAELVDQNPVATDDLFRAVVQETSLPAQFCDDTLVSLLRSQNSATFLDRHRDALFAHNRRLFLRVIHLLRVACVTTPAWLDGHTAQASLYNVPDGAAWAAVLRLVQNNLTAFEDGDRLLLLGLIEDWARGVAWWSPYPDGHESVAAIAHRLLPAFDDYRSDDRKRILHVIAKIPKSDATRFADLLHGRNEGDERDRASEEFRDLLFDSLECMPACRDLPDIVISVGKSFFLCSDADLEDGWGYHGHHELETPFGVNQNRSHGFFPASAYRGPFLQLLRHHPAKGISFLQSIFNHSIDWYAHPRVQSIIEPPVEITLTFADGTTRRQWCNARLWVLYRGFSVGPYALQCALMALEHALLEIGEAHPDRLDGILLNILKGSDSGAVTAVVASVATAFHRVSGETLLVLLSCQDCMLHDRGRFAQDPHGSTAGMFGGFPSRDGMAEIYNKERKQADGLPHRRNDLEMAVINLQVGPLGPRAHDIIDRHHANLPLIEVQTERDRVWLLALHRMDFRHYSPAENTSESPTPQTDPQAPSGEPQKILMTLSTPAPDIQDMIDDTSSQMTNLSERLHVQMWGMKVFDREGATQYDPTQWRPLLQHARTESFQTNEGHHEPGQGGPAYVASVCARDHWDEMSEEEREWCANVICSEVERAADHWHQFARCQKYFMSGDRPSARTLPSLLGRELEANLRARVRKTLVLAVTHAIDEVRTCAAHGIGDYLWKIDRDLAIRCVNALATEATLVQNAWEAERAKARQRTPEEIVYPDDERRQIDEIEMDVAKTVRMQFFKDAAFPDDAHITLDQDRWFGPEANTRILAIFSKAPTDPLAVAAFRRMTTTLVGWWDHDDDRDDDGRRPRRERNHETESTLTDLLERFLMRVTIADAESILEPIINAIDRHPDEIRWIPLMLIGLEDRNPNTAHFWSLWKLFADKIHTAAWMPHIDNEHPRGGEIMSAIFLGSSWKDNVRHWRSLEGHAHNIDSLFERLPPSSTILDDYVRFLYHVGERSLPDAFVRIANRLIGTDTATMLRRRNTIFMLETLLRRHVYGRPMELKVKADLRNAVLRLLDILVESGSSAAFRMRDDFVTPISTQ